MSSTVAQKILMSLTGLFLCLFLVIHLAGNLQLFLPQPQAQLQFNFYSELLSHNPVIKIAGLLTYASVLAHALVSLLLTRRNRAARPRGYGVLDAGASSTWYSRHMGLLGLLVLVFLLIHMKTFWYEYHWGPVGVDAEGRKDLYSVVLFAFSRWWYVSFYVAAMVGLGYHLLHGFANGWRSLGLHHRKYMALAQRLGAIFAIGVTAAFAAIPIYVYLQQEWLR